MISLEPTPARCGPSEQSFALVFTLLNMVAMGRGGCFWPNRGKAERNEELQTRPFLAQEDLQSSGWVSAAVGSRPDIFPIVWRIHCLNQ